MRAITTTRVRFVPRVLESESKLSRRHLGQWFYASDWNKFCVFLNTRMEIILAKKQSNKDWGGYEFVNRRLNLDERETAMKMFESVDEDVTALLDYLSMDGYKLSITWLDDNNTYNFSATQKREKHPHHGYIISTKSLDINSLIIFGWFKITHLLQDSDMSSLVRDNDVG